MRISGKRQRIPREAIVRAPGLLPMLYKTRELAEDLGVDQRMIVRWTQNGAPHERDAKGHIYVHGQLFASWIQSQRKARSRRDIPEDRGYCLRCNELVGMEGITERRIANMMLLTGTCPRCGGTVNRGCDSG